MTKQQAKTLITLNNADTSLHKCRFFNKVFVKIKQICKEIMSFHLNFLYRDQKTIFSKILRCRGISELALRIKVNHLFTLKQIEVYFDTFLGEICLKICTKKGSKEEAIAILQPIATEIRKATQLDCYGHDYDTLMKVVAKLLVRNKDTISVAESCTGGGLGAFLSSFPGSSNYFAGGVIAYNNQVKISLLKVSKQTLDIHGAVSYNTAKDMALGIKNKLGTSWGLSITGIAGPEGGTLTKPVGLVYIGIADPKNKASSIKCFFGHHKRNCIRSLSEYSALDQLRRSLLTKAIMY